MAKRQYLYEDENMGGFQVVHADSPGDAIQAIIEEDWEGIWDDATDIELWDITDAPRLTLEFRVIKSTKRAELL